MINIKKIFWLLFCNNIVLHIAAMDSQPNMSTLIGQLKKSAHYGIAPHVTNTIITAHNNNNNQYDQLVVDNGIQDHQNQNDAPDKRFKNIFDSVPLEIALEIAQYLDWSQCSEFNHRLAVNLIKRAQDGNRLDTIPQPIFAFVAKTVKKSIKKNPCKALIDNELETLSSIFPKAIACNSLMCDMITRHFNKKQFKYLKKQDTVPYVFCVEPGQQIHIPLNINTFAFTKDHKIIAGSKTGIIYIYDAHTGLLDYQQQCLPAGKMAKIDPNGTYFAMSYENGNTTIYDLVHQTTITLSNDAISVSALIFSQEGNYVAIKKDQKLYLYHLAAHNPAECTTTIELENVHENIIISEKNHFIISVYDNFYNFYDMNSGLRVKRSPNISPDTDYISHHNSHCIIQTKKVTYVYQDFYTYASTLVFDQAGPCVLQINLNHGLCDEFHRRKLIFSADGSHIAILLPEIMIINCWRIPTIALNPLAFEQKIFVYALKHLLNLNRIYTTECLHHDQKPFVEKHELKKIIQKKSYQTLCQYDQKLINEILKTCMRYHFEFKDLLIPVNYLVETISDTIHHNYPLYK